MPVNAVTTADDGWYSFDEGPVHFVMMNTEKNCTIGSPQMKFFTTDLAAVNRAATPWVIFAGHRPMYSSSDNSSGFDMQDGPWWPDLENVLAANAVDLCLWGHVHNAELTCPMINGQCTDGGIVHAIIGNGGQSLSSFGNTTAPHWSVWRLAEFGFATLLVEGATSLTIDFFVDQVPSPNEKVFSHTIYRS